MFLRLMSSVFIVLLFATLLPAQAPSSEAELLATWEVSIKSDPSTITFEKIADRRYRFKTRLFPFDGELHVLNVLIDNGYGEYGTQTGSIETDLVGLSEETRKKYTLSIAHSRQKNVLYLDKVSGQWLGSTNYFARLYAANSQTTGALCLPQRLYLGWWLVLLLAAFLVFLLVVVVRAQRRAQAYYAKLERNFETAERNAKLNEDNNRVLREILECMKAGRAE